MVVGPASVKVGSGLGPGEGSTTEELLGADLVGFHGDSGDVFLDELLLGEVKNLDASLGSYD